MKTFPTFIRLENVRFLFLLSDHQYAFMKKILGPVLCLLVFATACRDKNDNASNSNTGGATNPPPITNVTGYNLLNKVKGIWNGPVTSTTLLGGYPEWIVDFRPISENQVSAKNELDTLNDIHMSFFIALYNNQYKVAFRNGGAFGGNQRVSYFLADSVSEGSAKSYYRFSEIKKGKTRAFTEVIFSADSLYIKSYTNKYNSLPAATPHMTWSAKLQDSTSCQAAVTNFGFPKMTMTKDFTSSFTGVTEAIYYNSSADPYPETAQPYLGQTSANFTFATSYAPSSAKKVLLIITTQPLFSGPVFLSANLKYRSRYVFLSAANPGYTFNYMHPGTYYYYTLYDNDDNKSFGSGDWVSTANTTFTLGAVGTATTSTQINFTIP